MGYVESVLRPGEQVIGRAKLHWVIYVFPATVLVAAFLIYLAGNALPNMQAVFTVVAGIGVLIAAVAAARAWFDQWITEIAVTNLRVIYKKGFISRTTSEMNMEKVESVTVDQSLFGRILGYGTLHVLGTGEGITHLHRVADPIGLRNAIIAR